MYPNLKKEVKNKLSIKTIDKYKYIKRSIKRKNLFLTTPLRSYGSDIENIFHGCMHRTGSQWIKAVFSDRRIQRITGLKVHPQFRYDSGEFKFRFPRYTFVPCLYISYDLYDLIEKPENYKTLYIVRDPRELIVSWYYSTKYTHNLSGRIPDKRNYLNSVSEREGISYSIKVWQLKLAKVKDWWLNRDDENVTIIKFEDLVNNTSDTLGNLLDGWGYNFNKDEIENVVKYYNKENMRKRDMKNRDGKRSKYRKDKKGWRELFNDKHIEMFKSLNGDIVNQLNYEDW